MLKKLFITQLVLLVAIAILHGLAEHYSIYWTHKWTDIPMHFLGGVWVALAATWAYHFLKERYNFAPISSHILFVALTVLIVALGWELLEVFIWNYAGTEIYLAHNYIPDTILDLTMDALGAIAVLYTARIK